MYNNHPQFFVSCNIHDLLLYLLLIFFNMLFYKINFSAISANTPRSSKDNECQPLKGGTLLELDGTDADDKVTFFFS